MKLIPALLLLVLMSLTAFGQDVPKAEKFDEFGLVYCCELGARADFARIKQHENPGSKVHVIFYSGRKHEGWKTDRRTGKKEPALVDPVRNEYRAFLREFMKRIMFQRLGAENLVIRDGGFRERLTVEIWLVPEGAASPELTPTVNAEEVKFRKGRTLYQDTCAGT